MFPNLHVFSFIVPLYPLCVAAGFLIGTVIVMYLGKKLEISENKSFILMCFVEIGVILGGKILFLVVNIHNLARIFENLGFLAVFTKTGFVFFGGVFGGIIAVLAFSKIYKFLFREILSLVLSVAPLIHAIGRIGCLCAGCCYGIEWARQTAIFIHNAYRFPIQLLEALLNLILFFILQVFFIQKKEFIIPLYFGGYGIIRFFCEFFRGDMQREFIGVLSVSSWISIVCILLCILEFFCIRKLRYTCNE